VAEGSLQNQDLHNSTPKDLLIISYPAFITQAQRLAQLHEQRDGMRTLVVTTVQVFNEFGGGSPDPTAFRDLVKMYHDKYGNNPANKPDYLVLFGDASYDFKNNQQ
jgi:hypothetical protein